LFYQEGYDGGVIPKITGQAFVMVGKYIAL
jgi:hypothetical protein